MGYMKIAQLKIVEMFGILIFAMFNATFNNISVISWRSVLSVKEIGVLEENHQPVTSH